MEIIHGPRVRLSPFFKTYPCLWVVCGFNQIRSCASMVLVIGKQMANQTEDIND